MTDATVPEEATFQFDSLLRPEFTKCPWPYYKQMRDTNPVLRLGSEAAKIIFIARHEDIDYVLHNPHLFSSRQPGALEQGFPQIPIGLDPPEHSKWRRLLDPWFSPREMAKLKEDVTHQVNVMIDGFIERGECDYAIEYAVPLPCSVFMRLMGFPLEQLQLFVDLKDRMLRGAGENFGVPDDIQRAAREEITAMLEHVLVQRRREPRDDLITKLIHSEIDGQPLTHAELLGACHLLFFAGLDTVTDSLTCFYAFLARNPQHRRRLVSDPGIIPDAIEEMLRYESPVTMVIPRMVTEETELGGFPVHPGERIIPLLGSANNDERVINHPEVVDFDRTATRHYAFGGGVHRCLGSHLARLEMEVALQAWHERIPDYAIAPGEVLTYNGNPRAPHRLPLVWS